MKAIKIVLVFLFFLLPQTVRSSINEKASRINVTTASEPDYKKIESKMSVNEGTKAGHDQVQYTPYPADGTVIRQTQSVRITPEIYVSTKEFTEHVDSLFTYLYLTIEDKEDKAIIRKEQSMEKEANAYLFIIPAITILSIIGIIGGIRLGDSYLQKGSWVMLLMITAFTLFKIPVLLVLL